MKLKLILWVALPLLVATACRESTSITPTPEEATGSIQFSTSTSGTNRDTDGYTVSLDEGALKSIGVNGEVIFRDLAVAVYGARLGGVAGNCVVGGSNPRNVQVSQNQTIPVHFAVSCGP